MNNNVRKIKKSNYYIMLILILFHLRFFIFMFSTFPISQILMHMTNWSFIMSSIYLFLILIFDTNLYLFSSEKLEKINFFIRNTYSKIAFPYCFMITICYWLFLIFGFLFNINMYSKRKPKKILNRLIINTHLHFGITVIMILDLLFTKREEVKISPTILLINTIIFIIYSICTYIQKFVRRISVYIFMQNMGLISLIFVAILVYGIIIVSFFIYMKITNKINSNYIKEKENKKEYNIIKEEEMNDKENSLNSLLY